MLLTVAYSEGNLHIKSSGYDYLIAQSKSQEDNYLRHLQHPNRCIKATGKIAELLFVKESGPSGGSKSDSNQISQLLQGK